MQNRSTQIVLLIIAVLLLWPASNINWGKNLWVDILESDAKGYYAYLPAAFIYHDLNFGHFDQIEGDKYYSENLYYDYRFQFKGKTVNKYFAGTAMLQLPFFALAHVVASNSDKWDADGFSKPYMVAMNIAAIFYIVFGLFLLLRTLEPIYGKRVGGYAIFIVFATNLFYYGVSEPGMSHAYSFFLVSALIHFLLKYAKRKRVKYLLGIAVSLGLIVLIRPTNVLVVLAVPFILGKTSTEKFIQNLKLKRVLAASLVVIAVASIQLIIYYLQTGYFLVYAYGEEGFNWTNPQIINALFSFKKGALIYTPILLLCFFALIHNWKKERFKFWSFLMIMLPVLYVNYSWWNWWYGGSFSQRVLIEYYPVLVILVASWLHQLESGWVRKAVLTYSIICLVWCQFQTYQYRYNIIHWEDTTATAYFENLFVLPE